MCCVWACSWHKYTYKYQEVLYIFGEFCDLLTTSTRRPSLRESYIKCTTTLEYGTRTAWVNTPSRCKEECTTYIYSLALGSTDLYKNNKDYLFSRGREERKKTEFLLEHNNKQRYRYNCMRCVVFILSI